MIKVCFDCGKILPPPLKKGDDVIDKFLFRCWRVSYLCKKCSEKYFLENERRNNDRLDMMESFYL